MDSRIGRRITWNVYGIQFTGTVKSVFNDISDTEMLSVQIENAQHSPTHITYDHVNPASVFPPGSEHGSAQWMD